MSEENSCQDQESRASSLIKLAIIFSKRCVDFIKKHEENRLLNTVFTVFITMVVASSWHCYDDYILRSNTANLFIIELKLVQKKIPDDFAYVEKVHKTGRSENTVLPKIHHIDFFNTFSKDIVYFKKGTQVKVFKIYELLYDYLSLRKSALHSGPSESFREEYYNSIKERYEEIDKNIEEVIRQLEKETVWRIFSWLN